jgi:hypothetical protein
MEVRDAGDVAAFLKTHHAITWPLPDAPRTTRSLNLNLIRRGSRRVE